MDRRKFVKNIVAGGAVVTFGTVPLNLFAKKDEFVKITILHTNDIHNHIEPFTGTSERYSNKGGLARISAMAKHFRTENPNTLLFDAGDMFQGTPYFNFFKGEVILKVMSEAGYDAGTIGNHEFDNGLQGIADALPNAEFPIINSNYDFSDTILKNKFPRWKIFDRSGIKIGVYGLGVKLHGLVAEKNYENTIYNDSIKTAVEMETFLKKKKCDLIICLSHNGLHEKEDEVNDLMIAESTMFTDLIIGGHSHTRLDKPIIRNNALDKPVIVNQAWWGGLMMGKIDFLFERSGKSKKAVYSENI